MNKNFSFIQNKKLSLREIFIISLILLLVTCLLRFPAFSSFNSNYIGGTQGDAGLYVWLFNYNLRDIFQYGWFNTSNFYPYTKALAWSDNFIFPAIVGKFFVLLGFSSIVSYNLTLLLSTFLNGFFTFLLASKITGKSWLALTSALLFLSYNFFTLNLGHPQLQFAFWIPLALFCFIHFISNKNCIWGFFISLTFLGAFLSGVYFAIFIALLLFVFLFFFILIKPNYLTKKDYIKFFLALLIGLLPSIPFIYPYIAVKETFGSRYLFEPYAFSIGTLNYISYTKNIIDVFCMNCANLKFEDVSCGIIPIIISLLAIFRLRIIPHKKFTTLTFVAILLTLFLGALYPLTKGPLNLLTQYYNPVRFSLAVTSWISLILLPIFVFLFGKAERKTGCDYFSNRDFILILFSTAFFLFVLILGPLGDISSNKNENALGVFSLFFYAFPGLRSVRDISRLAIVVILCLSLVLPFVIMAITKPKTKLRNFITFFICCFIFAENFNTVFPLEPLPQTPTAFEKLKSLVTKDDVVLILPLTAHLNKSGNIKSYLDYATKNINYMNFASSQNLKIVNGYSGMITKIMRDYPRKMAHFPDERSLKALSTISGLHFVLFNKNEEPHYNEKDFNNKLNKFNHSISKIFEDESGWMLFEINREFLISKDYFLQVPSYPKGFLEINLKTPATKENSEVLIDLFAKIRIEDKPFYTISLPQDNLWHKFQIDTPTTIDSVRPLFFLFRQNNDVPVYIGDNHFSQ